MSQTLSKVGVIIHRVDKQLEPAAAELYSSKSRTSEPLTFHYT